jgi:hypothetical protein
MLEETELRDFDELLRILSEKSDVAFDNKNLKKWIERSSRGIHAKC